MYLAVYLHLVVPQHHLYTTTFFVPLNLCVRQLKDVEGKPVSAFNLGHVHVEPKQFCNIFRCFFGALCWCSLFVLVPSAGA
jgi:hypothetical protein